MSPMLFPLLLLGLVSNVPLAPAATVTAEMGIGQPNWKCPPNARLFCTLPAAFPSNVLPTGGSAGCVAGQRMRANAHCTVTCQAGTAPVPAGSPSIGKYSYDVTCMQVLSDSDWHINIARNPPMCLVGLMMWT